MPLTKLRRSFEERRNSLIEQLDKNRKTLDLSQQHQIFGAVKEIENFLKSIDYHRTLEAENAFDMDELSQEREWPVLKRTQKILNSTKDKCAQATTYTFVKIPIKIHKNIRGKIEAYRERKDIERQVKAEVEARMKRK